jgi:hypothetical protein
VSELILAHGGTAGFVAELAVLLVPAVILFWLMRRAKRDEAEAAGDGDVEPRDAVTESGGSQRQIDREEL